MRYHQGIGKNSPVNVDLKPQRRIATTLKCGAILLGLCVGTDQAQLQARPQWTRLAHSPDSPLGKDASFHSGALNRDMRYRIYLPHNYAATTRRYPVLYLLHGLYGDYENWDTRTNLTKYAAGMDWIIVMPDADDSWYTNSVTHPQDKFEDYVAKDVITEIDDKYRTIRDRHARAIAGLSMGGYGALKFALRNAQSFAFAGSLSGALDAARDLDSRRPEFAAKLVEVFGPPGTPARENNDLFHLLEPIVSKDVPYLYLACGTDDQFLWVNREFTAELARRNVVYECHETPGGHEWGYWDRQVRAMLAAMELVISHKSL